MTRQGIYDKYMRSDAWRRKAAEVIERDKECRTCCSKDRLEVHHRTYDRLGHEDMDDLITLCYECHEAITNIVRGRRYEKKRIVVLEYEAQKITREGGQNSRIQKVVVQDYRRQSPTSA